MQTVAEPHRRDGRPPPRWAVRAAHLAALTTVPSGVWRVALALGFGLGWSEAWLEDAAGDWSGRAYLVVLALVAEAFALLTLGLVQPWGEVLPRWVPVLGGRRIPPAAAIVPAALGSLTLMAMWTGAPLMFTSRYEVAEAPDGNWKLLMAACYLPLMFWGPLLAAVTWAYYRRRCTDRGAAGPRRPRSGTGGPNARCPAGLTASRT